MQGLSFTTALRTEERAEGECAAKAVRALFGAASFLVRMTATRPKGRWKKEPERLRASDDVKERPPA